MHYSWDYAQHVHNPHHSQEVGPLFFKTPRKCEVFGVCCEGTGKQVFYLTDEGESVGKGANSVVSYVHHYLARYGLGETDAQFHFDNCCGQYKNNIVLWYAMWRVIVGLHKNIKYGQMTAGHTKFEPDWHFGIWKSKWRYSNAETLDDVAASVLTSSRSGHNIPQLVDDAKHPVVFYSWKNFLSTFFKPLKNITKYHQFYISCTNPGTVTCKRYTDSEPESFNLLKSSVIIDPKLLPATLEVKGLNNDRQWYLFREIRDFCYQVEAKNKTCPKPVKPKYGISVPSTSDSTVPTKKRKLII